MSGQFTESIVEEAACTWFRSLRYTVMHGQEIAPDQPGTERVSFSDILLKDRLRAALARINPQMPADALSEAFRQLTYISTSNLIEQNRCFHTWLIEGIPVEYRRQDGSIGGASVRLVDYTHPDSNDWLVVNQFTIIEGRENRRPDIMIFLNGIPVGMIELKNPADANATIRSAFNQLQTYKYTIPRVFAYNEVLVVSDGIEARAGTLTAEWERFMPWRTINGDEIAPRGTPELEVLIKGIFERQRFLDLLRHFIVFETGEASTEKKMAAYHQFHAVNKAVASTIYASSPNGDRRVGVIWHTQGSGKSLSMVFYAGKLVQLPAMANPTLVLLTDRNDLDEQLFGTFSRCRTTLRQEPVRAETREELQKLLHVAAGGIVFTTIQKFFPESGGSYPMLSDRHNIVVIADEAHRSQYDFIDGFARHLRDALPNASFIGFTGTPIESSDRSTPAVFGDYIDIYDIQRAVEDGATVRIYYEGRLAKLALDEAERPKLDTDFEEVTEGEEQESKEKLKSKWARLEALVGADKRIKLIAQDISQHWEQRAGALEGKAMIVCMSRRICVNLYNALMALHPEWDSDDDSAGTIKVVMTGSATDPVSWQRHIRSKPRRERLAERFKDPNDPLKLVIVRDMWLTGFDAPSLHTMYLDKPMRGHGLMQAIARVNRVFKDKPGGLVADYLGLADQLKSALMDYTEGDRGEAGIPQDVAVEVLRQKYQVVRALFQGFDYSPYFVAAADERVRVMAQAIEHILTQTDGKKNYLQGVAELSKAFALAVPHEGALAIRDDVGFFQAVHALLVKATPVDGKSQEDIDSAVRQLVSKAVEADEVVDIFAAAGLKKPDISILSDEFLAEVKNLPQQNLALEILEKLLRDEIRIRSQRNLVQARSFQEMLEKAIIAYQNRTMAAAEITAQLIELAKKMREAQQRGAQLGLTDDELAFYDALAISGTPANVFNDDTLRTLARELVQSIKQNATIDWTVRESAQAKLRTVVKRLLRKYGYPADQQEVAIKTVMEQAAALSQQWAA